MNYNGYSLNVVREHNIKIITRLLYGRALSCKELAEITELSETAIKKNMTQLLETGLVKVHVEEEVEKKNVGRQHIRYEINSEYGGFLCIEFSYNNDNFFIADVCGNILYREKLDLKVKITKDDFKNISLKAIQVASKLNVKLHEVAISIPGQIDNKTGIINFSSRIEGPENINILEHFTNYFPDAMILIQNDIRFAIYGDEHLNERSQDTMALYVQIGFGIVSAIVNNGKILSGFKGIAGEIGTSVDEDGISVHEKCAISELMTKAKNIAKFDTFEEYMQIYNNNDEVKNQVMLSARLLAHEIDSITNAVGSNNIILLGNITKYGNAYLDEVQKTLNKFNNSFSKEVCFLLDDDLIEKGMIKLLKERICYSITK